MKKIVTKEGGKVWLGKDGGITLAWAVREVEMGLSPLWCEVAARWEPLGEGKSKYKMSWGGNELGHLALLLK